MEKFDFVALDIETATPKRANICEIGVVAVKDENIVQRRDFLIQPPGNYYSVIHSSIHGISKEMTENCPSFADVADEISSFINGNLVVCHNSSFDIYSLIDAFFEAGKNVPDFNYLCSYRMAKIAFPGLFSYSLALLCKDLGIPFSGHHRAASDAEGCANILLKILDVHNLRIDNVAEELGFKPGSVIHNTHDPFTLNNYCCIDSTFKGLVTPVIKETADCYFSGREVCFTGSFALASRNTLLKLVAEVGGIPMDRIRKTTNVLVVGQQDYRIVGETGMSSKQRKAQDLIAKGQDLVIMSEDEFLMNLGIDA